MGAILFQTTGAYVKETYCGRGEWHSKDNTQRARKKKKKKKGETLETGGPTIAFKNMPLSTQEVFTRYYLQKIPHFPTLLL